MSLLLPLLLLLSVVWDLSHAFVPPRQGSDLEANFETVYDYWDRLEAETGVAYNYTPRLINAELCRFLTPQECQDSDQAMMDHARAHQRIQRRLARQRRLQQQQQQILRDNLDDFQQQLGAFTRTYLSGKPPTLEEERAELEALLQEYNSTLATNRRRRLQKGSNRAQEQHNPSVGSFVVPVLLMRFSDHANRELPEKYEYQILWNLRIKKWLDENSYGNYDAFFDVQDWATTDNTERHYSFGQAGRTILLQSSFKVLLNEMDERLGGDWSRYDADGDGFLDNLIILHSGYPAEEGGVDCQTKAEVNQRIWSHAFAASGLWTSPSGGYKTRGYMIASALDLLCDSNVAKMGVMTHEYLHTFFLIDQYDLQFVGKGIGNYDIMAYPYGVNHNGYIPSNLAVWSKETLEWMTCTPITSDGEYILEPIATGPACYKILLNDGPYEEYLLLENRQTLKFDTNFWQPGLVIYHIDDGAEDQMWTGYPGFDAYWPFSGDHYRIAVLQADGNYDLEKGNNIFDEGDVWLPGMALTPNYDNETYPNTDAYQYGRVQSTGLLIEVLEQDGLNVKVKVTFGEPVTEIIEPTIEDDPWWTPPKEQPATEQDPDSKISGKIPQLGWFQEWQQQQIQQGIVGNGQQEQQSSLSSSNKMVRSMAAPSRGSGETLGFLVTTAVSLLVIILM